MSDAPLEGDAPVELPIDGVLDLHTFRPQDVVKVAADYLRACQEAGILEVRIIHGKGIGELRRTIRNFLKGSAIVAAFADASALYGGLGATMVKLKPK